MTAIKYYLGMRQTQMTTKKSGDIPEKNSSQWIKNEKLIAKNPVLRQARDIQQGFRPGSGISTGGFGDNYDKIDFSNTRKQKKGYRVKINGVYQDEEE